MPSGPINYAAAEGYWLLAGGDPSVAATMAAIAEAESSLDPGSIQQGQPYATTGWGLWQITPGNSESQFGVDYQLLDPLTNAQAAVAKYQDAGSSFAPWTTYASGAYRQYFQQGVPAETVIDQGEWAPSGAAPAGTNNTSQAISGATSGGGASSTQAAASGATSVYQTYPTAPTVVVPFTPIPGLGTLSAPDITINGGPLNLDVSSALTDCIVERSIGNASTVTLQIDDPLRTILRSGIFSQGDQLTLNGLNFVMVQFAKTGDQLQLVFESQGIYLLRQQMDPVDPTGTAITAQATYTFDLSGFAWTLVSQVPGLGFVGETDVFAQTDGTFTGSNSGGIEVGRGTSSDPQEDSWTCLVRIATTAGWRIWENAGTIYFGSDEFWLSYFPVLGTLQEFSPTVFNIDFDWDVGKPLGNAQVTAVTELWAYPPGVPVALRGLGPADGNWLVYDMQRDTYFPTATITLTTPMAPPTLIANTAGQQTGSITSSGQPGLAGQDPGSPGSGTPSLTVTVSPSTSLTPGEQFSISCLVSGNGYGVTPTGTVTFYANGASDTWGTNLKLVNGVVTATIAGGWGAGQYPIYAVYTPDANSKWAPNSTQNEVVLITIAQPPGT